jgi:hypothetical protein
MIVGEGNYRYEVVEGWEQLPNGWSHGDVAGVATDSQDRVYVFNRSEHPVIVYDRDGTFLDTWGDTTLYPRAHGITIHNDEVYLVDATDQTVRKCTLDGKVLMTLGVSGQVSDTGYNAKAPSNLTTIARAAGPFNVPTRAAVAPNGEIYVSDGYGNARVHRYSAGASQGPVQASSTWSTRSGSTQTAASSSVTARTTASRSSARPARYSRSGTM